MMRFIRLSDYTWWIWLSLAFCLLASLLVDPIYFFLAILISTIQAMVFWARESSASSFPSQLRLVYLLLLVVLYVPPLRFLYWVPAIGTLPFLATLEPKVAANPSGNCEDIQCSSQS